MKITVDVSKLQEMRRTMPDKLDELLRGAAEEIVSNIKTSFGTSPGGETYMRGRVAHVASVAGYPPNVDTGALRSSIRWARGNKAFQYYVMDGVEYGVYLELGREGMRARPFFTPVFEAWRGRKFADYMSKLI